jgi:hypothetical protein
MIIVGIFSFLAPLAISVGSYKFANSTRASDSNNLLAGESFWGKVVHPTALFSVKRIQDFARHFQEGREPNEEALVERLRQFVENSRRALNIWWDSKHVACWER